VDCASSVKKCGSLYLHSSLLSSCINKVGLFSLQLLVIYNYYTLCHINLHFTIKFDGHVGKSHPTVILCDNDFKWSLYVWFIKAGEDLSSIAWRQFGGCKPSAEQQESKCLLHKTAVTHSNALEDSVLLTCETMLLGEWLLELYIHVTMCHAFHPDSAWKWSS